MKNSKAQFPLWYCALFLNTDSMKKILDLFSPNKRINKKTVLILVCVQIVAALFMWTTMSSPLIPRPGEIMTALKTLLTSEGLAQDLYMSTKMCLHAMLLTILISLAISYATVMPFFRPFAFLVTKLRFLTLVGLSFVFTLMTSGYNLKVSLLVFGMTVFFVTSLVQVVQGVTKNEYNHARTLGMNEWQVVWQVVIRGKIDQVFEIIRQNFAIAWMMVTMVEGIVRSDGGVGTMLLNQNKHLHLDAVFAIQLMVVLVGITQDYLFGVIKKIVCPYASITVEQK